MLKKSTLFITTSGFIMEMRGYIFSQKDFFRAGQRRPLPRTCPQLQGRCTAKGRPIGPAKTTLGAVLAKARFWEAMAAPSPSASASCSAACSMAWKASSRHRSGRNSPTVPKTPPCAISSVWWSAASSSAIRPEAAAPPMRSGRLTADGRLLIVLHVTRKAGSALTQPAAGLRSPAPARDPHQGR